MPPLTMLYLEFILGTRHFLNTQWTVMWKTTQKLISSHTVSSSTAVDDDWEQNGLNKKVGHNTASTQSRSHTWQHLFDCYKNYQLHLHISMYVLLLAYVLQFQSNSLLWCHYREKYYYTIRITLFTMKSYIIWSST